MPFVNPIPPQKTICRYVQRTRKCRQRLGERIPVVQYIAKSLQTDRCEGNRNVFEVYRSKKLEGLEVDVFASQPEREKGLWYPIAIIVFEVCCEFFGKLWRQCV